MINPNETPRLGSNERPAVIYPLLDDPGNQQMLVEWLSEREGYTIVDPDIPLAEATFDICILDVEAFKAHIDTLEATKQDAAPIQLPYLLLLSNQDREVIEQDRQQLIDNVVWRNIDEIIEVPLGKTELYWRIQSLLRIRGQSIQMAQREGQYRSIVQDVLNSIDIGLILFDADNSVTWANDAIEQLFGFSPTAVQSMDAAELRGEYLGPIVTEDAQFGRHYRHSFETEGSFEFPEFRVEDQWFTGRSDPITVGTLAGGTVHQYWDITRQRETYQQLSVVDRILRHNLRNQLTVIRGRAEDIADAVSGTPADDAATIVTECNTLMTTADKSRNVTELLAADIAPKLVNLSERVRDLAARLEQEHPDATVETAIESDVIVRAVPAIESAIEELAANGIVHNDSDTPRVTIGLESGPEMATITVTDNGSGIPDLDQRVLEQGEEMDDFYHGSGLGMWLVHLIVRKSGGQITVTEATESGSTVEIAVPYAKQIHSPP